MSLRNRIFLFAGLWFVFSANTAWTDEQSGAILTPTISQPINATTLSKLRSELRPLDFGRPATASPGELAYFNYYRMHTPEHDHYFGTFVSGNYTLAAHVFRPVEARGTVVLMHGFLDHVGTLSGTIRHLLQQGFAVAAYDQPGHGLSSGERASINDFADYAGVFDDFLGLVQTSMPPPLHCVAHSTGAAIVADHLLTHDDGELEQVVLVAPLVRSAFWFLSTLFTPVVETFTDNVPRVFQDNSSDEQFLAFVRQDPLQPKQTSLSWFNALVNWNERVERYTPNPRPLVIIQGNRDSIVAWEYNLDFLTGKFPGARIHMIDNAEHQLLNEESGIRAEVLGIIDATLAVSLSR